MPLLPKHADQVQAWSSPPVDHKNAYLSSAKLLQMTDHELDYFIGRMGEERYGGWRNNPPVWTEVLLADVADKLILDYGCGVGLEAFSLASRGAWVDLADISTDNLELARRVLARAPGPQVANILYLVRPDYPYIDDPPEPYDIFYCNGVLHHIPYPIEVMHRAWEITKPGGQARLMLYTAECWVQMTKTMPPDYPTHLHPSFQTFVRAMDGVGQYADWYSPAKLERMFGDWWSLERWEPMTPWGRYAAAILRRNDG